MRTLCFSLLSLLFLTALNYPSVAQVGVTSGGIEFTAASSPAAATFQSALQYHDIGETVKAREALLQAVAQDPKLTIAYLFLTDYGTSSQEIISFTNKAKENLSTANEWEKLFYDFRETYAKADLNQRLTVAKKMVAQFDGKARSYFYLASAYSGLNDVANQRKNLQQAIAIEPTWPGAYAALFSSYLVREPREMALAQQTAEKFVSVAPNAGLPHILLGDAYRAQNNFTKAEEAYSKVIAMNPTQPLAYASRGHIHAFLGNYDKARADYKKYGTLSVAPTTSRIYFASNYLYEGKPQKAMQSLLNDANSIASTMEKASAATAKFNFLSQAAFIARHMRDLKAYQQITAQLRPISEEMASQVGSEEARRVYKSVVMGNESVLKAMNKDFAGANQNAEEMKALAEQGTSPLKLENYHFTMGYMSLLQKDFKTAAMYFEKLDKAVVYNQYSLAKAYEGMGEKEKAKAIYKSLVNYNINNVGYALIRNELKKKV